MRADDIVNEILSPRIPPIKASSGVGNPTEDAVTRVMDVNSPTGESLRVLAQTYERARAARDVLMATGRQTTDEPLLAALTATDAYLDANATVVRLLAFQADLIAQQCADNAEVCRQLDEANLRLTMVQEALTNRFDHADPGMFFAVSGLDYHDFEREMRGSRDDVKQRQMQYVERIKVMLGTVPPPRVLDIGCGRGEWLELCQDAGFIASGVDSNPGMVADCQAHGLTACNGEAFAFLADLPPASRDVVSIFHVIEHFPYADVPRLLAAITRVLRPDGLLVLETPNAANLTVAAHEFLNDPTHRRPLPPDLLSFLIRHAGYELDSFLYLNPHPAFPYEEAMRSPVSNALWESLWGPRDLGIVAKLVG